MVGERVFLGNNLDEFVSFELGGETKQSSQLTNRNFLLNPQKVPTPLFPAPDPSDDHPQWPPPPHLHSPGPGPPTRVAQPDLNPAAFVQGGHEDAHGEHSRGQG